MYTAAARELIFAGNGRYLLSGRNDSGIRSIDKKFKFLGIRCGGDILSKEGHPPQNLRNEKLFFMPRRVSDQRCFLSCLCHNRYKV